MVLSCPPTTWTQLNSCVTTRTTPKRASKTTPFSVRPRCGTTRLVALAAAKCRNGRPRTTPLTAITTTRSETVTDHQRPPRLRTRSPREFQPTTPLAVAATGSVATLGVRRRRPSPPLKCMAMRNTATSRTCTSPLPPLTRRRREKTVRLLHTACWPFYTWRPASSQKLGTPTVTQPFAARLRPLLTFSTPLYGPETSSFNHHKRTSACRKSTTWSL